MKAKTKAALISALLFPGLGHFVLKRAMRGCLFIVPTLLAIGVLLWFVTVFANRAAGAGSRRPEALNPGV